MKTIIAGSRYVISYDLVRHVIADSGFTITEVVSGCARGVDAFGEIWAKRNGVPVRKFPADWNTHGKEAGPIRNQQMADYAEALIAIPGPESRGTWDMVRRAKARGLRVYVYEGEANNE